MASSRRCRGRRGHMAVPIFVQRGMQNSWLLNKATLLRANMLELVARNDVVP